MIDGQIWSNTEYPENVRVKAHKYDVAVCCGGRNNQRVSVSMRAVRRDLVPGAGKRVLLYVFIHAEASCVAVFISNPVAWVNVFVDG